MGQSYRIRTESGVNKTINIQLDQEYEYLEILSLKIQQSEIYARPCADYGVLVGRVTANNGFGIPNARVSVFIPILPLDESDPIITSIYPYKSPTDKNEDGYRYNLLPYEQSYSTHVPTGTLPTRIDVLTGNTAIEIYDKYYKFTTKTNSSGDYMIMGAPLGIQTIVMDVDLSDIGEFSLTPQDLIRLGRATEAQVSGNKFKKSNDLNSLPQIVNITKSTEVSPLWGDPSVCQIAVNRVDFDLRDDANIDIVPTSVFMGSMFSSIDKNRVRSRNLPIIGNFISDIKSNLGSICNLTTGPGQILAIRQTPNVDQFGYPILEVYDIEKSGNVIDQDGTWLIELPMNLEYVVTNEFGEKIISNNPGVGIPTKAKYRFKIKWQQPASLQGQVRRAYYLVPNIKEYGWNNSSNDPYNPVSNIVPDKVQSTYYFGLDFSGYTKGFLQTELVNRINEIINCEDTFYEFKFNKVYTIASLIDQYQSPLGDRSSFIGIKEINDDDCSSTVNKFPVNEGFLGYDALYYLFSLLMLVFQIFGIPFVIILHVVVFIYGLINLIKCGICEIIDWAGFDNPSWCKSACDDIFIKPGFPILRYPSCEACECTTEYGFKPNTGVPATIRPETSTGVLTYVSDHTLYIDGLFQRFSGETIEPPGFPNPGNDLYANLLSFALAGYDKKNQPKFKIPTSDIVPFSYEDPTSLPPQVSIIERQAYSYDLPIGERINIFNNRKSYFDGLNRIKVTFDIENNPPDVNKFHYDNSIVVLSNTEYTSGQILVCVSTLTSSDPNYLFSADTEIGLINGISGETLPVTSGITVNYVNPDNQLETLNTQYNLSYGSQINRYIYPADVEYFQVITAITVSTASQIWDTSTVESFPNILMSESTVFVNNNQITPFESSELINYQLSAFTYLEDYNSQYILILQRGVDPYSPYYDNVFKLGKLFGKDIDDESLTITASTKLNIPIQKLNTAQNSVQNYNQEEMYYGSYFFKPISGPDGFSGFSTNNLKYYGKIDSGYNIAGQGKMDVIPLSNGVLSNVTNDSNNFYDVMSKSTKYDLSENLAGGGFMYSSGNFEKYYTDIFSESFYISNSEKTIMRTDRLPSSDRLDGESFTVNPALLQQNNNFRFYVIAGEGGNTIIAPAVTTGADTTPINIVGIPGSAKVLETLNNCENMVDLDCYEGFGETFKVNKTKKSCKENGIVQNGCYILCKIPFVSIPADIEKFYEWAFRYRYMYGICRGLIAESFMNNWVNGTLFAFPIQTDTKFSSNNRPRTVFPSALIFFDSQTNNFYYRCTPYDGDEFIGRTPSYGDEFIGRTPLLPSVNKRNLMFPTTVVDLGMKNRFYSEIVFDPETKGYILDNLEGTSYGDTSDLVNFFIITRITDASFLEGIIGAGDGSIRTLFTRVPLNLLTYFRVARLDADLAQMYSINSEIGVVKFSPEYYELEGDNPPVLITGTESSPVMAIWYSSTTEDLQTKDYLTPGRINFRTQDNLNNYPFNYNIKSQVVPFYQWELKPNNNIFGTQQNNWATNRDDIVQNKKYQSLDRTILESPTYFQVNREYINDLPRRGYIFSIDENGRYSITGAKSNKFMVGAPFHFYFGLKVGATAYDKFKIKYSTDE